MELVFYKIVRPLLKTFFIVVFRPKYIGLENIPKEGRVVLAGNHTDNLDCIALISATNRQIHFLGKHTLFSGIKGVIFKWMGVIPVDRTRSSNHEALTSAIEVLNRDSVIGIFPESTINRTKDVLMPFKMGAVKMSYETDAKIVPFAIKGEYKPFKRGLTITFGEPLEVDEHLESANKELMNRVVNLLER